MDFNHERLKRYNPSMALKIGSGDSGSSPPPYGGELKLAVININDEESLSKWETILALSRSELIEAIKNFGPVVRDIRRGLRAQYDEAA